jgi:hypothetical protein
MRADGVDANVVWDSIVLDAFPSTWSHIASFNTCYKIPKARVIWRLRLGWGTYVLLDRIVTSAAKASEKGEPAGADDVSRISRYRLNA